MPAAQVSVSYVLNIYGNKIKRNTVSVTIKSHK